MYDIRQRSMLDGLLLTLAGLAERTGRRRVRQRCAGLNRTGLAGPPLDGLQDNIAAEFSVVANAASQNRVIFARFWLVKIKIRTNTTTDIFIHVIINVNYVINCL